MIEEIVLEEIGKINIEVIPGRKADGSSYDVIKTYTIQTKERQHDILIHVPEGWTLLGNARACIPHNTTDIKIPKPDTVKKFASGLHEIGHAINEAHYNKKERRQLDRTYTQFTTLHYKMESNDLTRVLELEYKGWENALLIIHSMNLSLVVINQIYDFILSDRVLAGYVEMAIRPEKLRHLEAKELKRHKNQVLATHRQWVLDNLVVY
jgi:hypothetical protein